MIITPHGGRISRYYVTREAIADGYDTCAVTSVPAADVEGAVLDRVQKLLAAPELVARTWAAAKRAAEHEITEREVTVLLADFATVWSELFPAEQARMLQAGRVVDPDSDGRRLVEVAVDDWIVDLDRQAAAPSGKAAAAPIAPPVAS